MKVKLNSRAICNLQECRNDGKKLREAEDKKRVGKILISGRLTCLCISCYYYCYFYFQLVFFAVELKTRKVHSRKIKIFPTLNLDLLGDLGSGGEISK